MTLEKQVLRWKFVALLAVAVLVGYVTGQLTSNANAQGVTKLQLDTSNCVFGVTRFVSELEGTLVVQADPTATPGINSYVFNACW